MMQTAIDLALVHGWADDAVAELERHLTNRNVEEALTLIRAHDMPTPERQDLMAMVVLAIVS